MKYKVGDTVQLKTLDELMPLVDGCFDIANEGFYFKSGFYINSDMYDYLGEKYKIEVIRDNDYMLKNIVGWVWVEECFKEEPEIQMEFDFE